MTTTKLTVYHPKFNNTNTALILGLLSVFAFSLTLPFSKIAVQALTGLEVGLLHSFIDSFS